MPDEGFIQNLRNVPGTIGSAFTREGRATVGRGVGDAAQILPLGGATRVVGQAGRFGARVTAGATARREVWVARDRAGRFAAASGSPSLGASLARNRGVQYGIGAGVLGTGLAFGGKRAGQGAEDFLSGIGTGAGNLAADVGTGAGAGLGGLLGGTLGGIGQGAQTAGSGLAGGLGAIILPLALIGIGVVLYNRNK